MSNDNIRLTIQVAPFAGAWIEIGFNTVFAPFGSTSLPSRERGLKSYVPTLFLSCHKSLPSRERGLKSVLTQFSHHSAARRSLRGSVD